MAVGLYTKNITGNLDYQNTISFYRSDQLLGSVDYVLPSGGWTFYGWRDPLGVDRISVNSSNAWAIVDTIEWGIAVPEPSMGVLLLMVLAGVSSRALGGGVICARRRKGERLASGRSMAARRAAAQQLLAGSETDPKPFF